MKIERGKTLSAQVYSLVRERILSGEYSPGVTIVESELANELGVSRTPVSNAVIMLRERGLLEAQGGRFRILDLTISDVLDLYACRLAFDGLAARLAATRITNKTITELKALIDVWEQTDGATDANALWVADLSFHSMIYEASDNTHLIRFAEIASDLLSTYRRVILANLPKDERAYRTQADVRKEHTEILNALATRDPSVAEAAAKAHVRKVIEYLEGFSADQYSAAVNESEGR